MKSALKKLTNNLGYEVVNVKARAAKVGKSNLDEDKLIHKYLSKMNIRDKYCIDVGASDGQDMSNSYSLFKNGWQGLAIECDPTKFYRLAQTFKDCSVSLANAYAKPTNITMLLEAFYVPKSPEFLSIDIDGYDYFVLKEILSKYRPQLIVAEINEKIPPPLKFSVKFDEDYFWDNSHFYGQSLGMLDELMASKQYTLLELHYNNAFYAANETGLKGKKLDVAYREGYWNKKDRDTKFPWNKDVIEAYDLDAKEAIKFFNKLFSSKKGKYVLTK